MSRSAELRIADLSRVIAPLTHDVCPIAAAPTTCSRDDYLFRQAEATMQIEHTHATRSKRPTTARDIRQCALVASDAWHKCEAQFQRVDRSPPSIA